MLFQTGYNFCEFLFATLNEMAFLKWGLLLKERTCSNRSKFSPLIVKPTTDTCIKVRNMVKKPENPNSRSSSRRRLEDLELGLFGLFNRISDLNTSSCEPIEEGKKREYVLLKVYPFTRV